MPRIISMFYPSPRAPSAHALVAWGKRGSRICPWLEQGATVETLRPWIPAFEAVRKSCGQAISSAPRKPGFRSKRLNPAFAGTTDMRMRAPDFVIGLHPSFAGMTDDLVILRASLRARL